MINIINKIGAFRLRYLAGLAGLFLALNLATRLALQLGFSENLPVSLSMLPGLGIGLVNDLAALAFVLLLPGALILLPSNKFLARPTGRVYCLAIVFGFSLIFIFTAFAEYFFWDEFGARFNFIAVDYLIYTTEMLRNIVESYPLAPLLSAVAALALLATAVLWRALRWRKYRAAVLALENTGRGAWRWRLAGLGLLYAAAAALFMLFTPLAGSQNRFWNEYAKNGAYELFSAYFNNQLDYRAFYQTMDKNAAFALMRRELGAEDHVFVPKQGDGLVREVAGGGAELRPNVIVVLMESMGRTWLEGKYREYTPNLQALAAQGLSFSRMMSTGARTVRGIEAVMLGVPPTPGNSIVRRPDNDDLFSLGTLFRDRNYELSFIYGGIGYFDNMNAFFSGNGYAVVDKLSFAPQNKTFATAWGQCDEDLYAESLSRADASFAAGKPFQQVLLTTSNHRPFTYPKGRVDIEPGTSRRGAVAYSDYAVGEFMRAARGKPWFNNTVFVFVGDHPASIAGKSEVPADAYGIVCIMYGPRFFRPEAQDVLCSQIDVAPTLLAALNWDYHSQFFGTDARALPKAAGRAWISTYQLLGFRTNDQLAVLRPDGSAKVSALNSGAGDALNNRGSAPVPAGGNDFVRPPAVPAPTEPDSALSGGPGWPDEAVVDRAVASYQCAYDLYAEKRLKEEAVAAYVHGDKVLQSNGVGRVVNSEPGNGAGLADRVVRPEQAGRAGNPERTGLKQAVRPGRTGLARDFSGAGDEAAFLLYLKFLAGGVGALQ